METGMDARTPHGDRSAALRPGETGLSTESSVSQSLHCKIENKSAVVAVCGLGYVGLPLVCAIAKGFKMLGFDIDAQKIASLNAGDSYIGHIPSSSIAPLVKSGYFAATNDFRRIREADVILICVPTPLTRHREPDLSYVIATASSIAENARPGQLIILESTTYPGTTTEVMAPIFLEKGLQSGRDIFLAFSPEREDPGNAHFETVTIPKVVGGDGADALGLATLFYRSFVRQIVPVSTTATAEAIKLTENIFRAVNIALVNELKIIFSKMGIDIWEVIEAAKTKPFGFMPFYPGPGLGGHCIPIDPFYLTWKAREYEIATRLIELAGEINTAMPSYVIARLIEELDSRFSKGLNGARVLVVGLAYKKNVDDVRESPSFRLMELMTRRGAIVDYYDPLVPQIPKTREHAEFSHQRAVPFTPESIAGFDAALIATDHDCVDYNALVEHSKLVVDTRNVCSRSGVTSDKIAKA